MHLKLRTDKSTRLTQTRELRSTTWWMSYITTPHDCASRREQVNSRRNIKFCVFIEVHANLVSAKMNRFVSIFSQGKLLHLILHFAGNVPLDARFESLMDSPQDWEDVKALTGSWLKGNLKSKSHGMWYRQIHLLLSEKFVKPPMVHCMCCCCRLSEVAGTLLSVVGAKHTWISARDDVRCHQIVTFTRNCSWFPRVSGNKLSSPRE